MEQPLNTNHVAVDGQLFVVPFAKSATTGQHCPVNGDLPKTSVLVLISVFRTIRDMLSCKWATVR